jgi:DNA-directed RNA polymerase subunit RPC12/RpoP
MSTAVIERPPLFRDTHRPPGRDDAPRRRPGPSGGRPTTLEQHLERVWEGLAARSSVSCPACGSGGQWQQVAATHPSDSATGGFRCTACGTRIA